MSTEEFPPNDRLHELCEQGLGSDPASEELRADIIAKLVGARSLDDEPEESPEERATEESRQAISQTAIAGTVAAFPRAVAEFSAFRQGNIKSATEHQEGGSR